MLVVRLFGPLELTAGDRRLGPRDLDGVKPKQVLEILLLERGHPVSKDRIADLLWGEELPRNVSATLETYVWVLRRQLERALGSAGRVLVTEPGAYRFDAERAEVDLDRFDALVAGGRRVDLDAALALVRGEVLEDEPYASWALRWRERYRARHLEALLGAATAALRDGDHDLARDLAEAAVARDPAQEHAFRLLMLAAYAGGRQNEALRAFERCQTALAEELGVDPLPETVGLHGAIVRREDPVALLRPPGDSSRPRARESRYADDLPLLDRTEELAALQAAAEGALTGRGGCLLVEGEAGVGKSRLLDELTARLPPCRVGRAKCYELDPDVPFVPLAAALRAAEGGRAPVGEAGRLPALGEIFPEFGPSVLPPEAARGQALRSLASLVEDMAPLALLIDDLQWADPSTLAALAFLGGKVGGAPLLVVGAFRSEDVGHEHPVRRLDASLHFELGPLTPADLAPLGVEGLFEQTGGNPLFVVERLRALAEGSGEAVPENLREVIVARCRAAGAGAHRLLAAASVVGRAFTPSVLGEMSDTGGGQLLGMLETLCARRLLHRDGERFDFRHDVAREVLYGSLSESSRRALHGRALRVLEATGADQADLAHHALQAGALELAVRYAIAAGDAARSRWANVEAAARYQGAAELAEAHPGLLEPPAFEALLLKWGRVLVTIGQAPQAEKILERARASAAGRGDEPALFEAFDALVFARQRGASDPRGSLGFARSALEVAERIGDHALLARAHTLVGSPSGSLGLIDDALEHCHQALAHAQAGGLPPRAYPMGRIAFMLRHRGRDAEVIEWSARAEEAARAEHDEETLLLARWVRALALSDLGRYDEAWRALDSIAEVGRGEEVFWHARVPNTYGSILADLGLFAMALERDQESLDAAQGAPAPPIREAELQTRLNLAWDHLGLGHLREARSQLERVRAASDEVEYGRFRWLNRFHFLDAEVATAEGDPERSRAAAERCLAMAAEYRQVKNTVRGQIALARATAGLGEHGQALRQARTAGRLASRAGFPGLGWRAWWLAQQLSGASGDTSRAQAEVARIAAHLDAPHRVEFLASVPVPP